MIVYLRDTGDHSVGIFPSEVEIKFNWDVSDIEREDMRKKLVKMVEDYLDFQGHIYCHFEDECPDCYSRLDEKTKMCPWKGCINNL